MSLARYEPWRRFGPLQDEINRVFAVYDNDQDNDTSAATASWVPPVDIHESKEQFFLLVDIPGVDPKLVDITLDKGVLTISGERDTTRTADETVARRSERHSGRFYRRFNLPDTVDADNVKATNRHGVLEISIPKQEKAKPRRIEVAA